MRLLIADNDDSFTRNLEHLLAVETGVAPVVVNHARLDFERARSCDLLVISPGPGHPDDYPAYFPLLRDPACPPVLGICLGMQLINQALGGQTDRLKGCVHGKAEAIPFQGGEAVVARYHSLAVSGVAPELVVESENAEGTPMILAHPSRPLLGYQFHPESFLTHDPGRFIRHAIARLL
ncbi:aminodeoxychorismate/anthranilate synthase component II [Desulfohalovibrio reitneri]|uniref:aminodeoxychorismate/anthranilate synthase component II n=1 Tax=Desulfohalovibrio reitneri TaxID=1307759 RepID=UPI0004A75FC9|nr:aminodeoxychorismate/anthranilate synthase component II [Desulfohalovibrio reitneri]